MNEIMKRYKDLVMEAEKIRLEIAAIESKLKAHVELSGNIEMAD